MRLLYPETPEVPQSRRSSSISTWSVKIWSGPWSRWSVETRFLGYEFGATIHPQWGDLRARGYCRNIVVYYEGLPKPQETGVRFFCMVPLPESDGPKIRTGVVIGTQGME